MSESYRNTLGELQNRSIVSLPSCTDIKLSNKLYLHERLCGSSTRRLITPSRPTKGSLSNPFASVYNSVSIVSQRKSFWRGITMTTVELIQSKFGYEHWANSRALESIQSVSPPPEKAQRWLAHIYLAHLAWFCRLNGEPMPKLDDMFPLHSCEELAGQVAELRRMWSDYIAGLTEEKLASRISYFTLKGKPFESSVLEILLHVTNHSTYHRGQIASAVREAGGNPLATDYIMFARNG